MKSTTSYLLQILALTASTRAAVALPFGVRIPSLATTTTDNDPARQQPHQQQQQPLTIPFIAMPGDDDNGGPPVRGGVLISDVMGSDRSINVFASYARDASAVASRLDSTASGNSTVLAPLNSAVEALPRKPWEDPREYGALGAAAYEGGDGRDRAQRNLRRFVEAHVVATSPWAEGERARSLLDGDREIWWEKREDGTRVIQPDGIEVSSVANRVGNGEVWILSGVRNYA